MRRVGVPVPAAAPEEAGAKGWPRQEGSLGRKVLSWEARGAASPLGGMKQPRISAGGAKHGSSAQSASSNCLGSQGAARCQVQHRAGPPRSVGTDTRPGGAWPQVSNDAAEATAGRERGGPDARGNHIRWARALCSSCRPRAKAPAPSAENTASLSHLQAPLSVPALRCG